ncbi:MAG: GNAT family N-acetyltransferase [Candidatus Polarisedimenticolia bacterium]
MIVTERLEIVPATVELTREALGGPRALGAALGAAVPATWPPEYFDEPALRFTIERLTEGPGQEGWWMHFVLLKEAGASRILIGSGGYKGPPSADGTVEVGYSIVGDRRRQGYASEATRGLVARAFAAPAVRRVISETLPVLAASIGVLRKCGFRLIGEGSEPGVIRFELTRADFTGGSDRARARN